VTRGCYNTQ